MKNSISLIILAIFMVIILSIVKTVLSERLSTSGVSLAKIEEEINNYKMQNTVLKEKLLTVSSLNNIASKALLLGFIEKKSEFVLSKPLPLAVKQ